MMRGLQMVLPLAAMILLGAPLSAQVTVTKEPTSIRIDVNHKPFTEFFFGPETTKPYLHPLRSASGKRVTRGYPMENIPGESRDHIHQRGLWFTHGDVNGFDFWGNDPSQQNGKKGVVVLKNIGQLRSGEKSGSLEATFEWREPTGKPLLTESRKMVFYADPKLRIIDFDILLTALEKVKFGDTKEGTFAIRLCSELEEPTPKSLPFPKRSGKMVNAEGLAGEQNVWGKRSPWVDYFGVVDGEKLGIAIFDNPANPRYPTYWHSRSYGLFAANIFGVHDFTNDKSRDASLTLETGKSLRFRYRVVIHPGDVSSAGIAGLYRDYAAGK